MLLQEWNLEEALEVSKEEGREEGIAQIAKTMKDNKEPVEKIIKFTGLTVEEIETL